jgi:long-chain acyl-CoA synthetase
MMVERESKLKEEIERKLGEESKLRELAEQEGKLREEIQERERLMREQMEAKGKFMKGFFNFVLDYKKFWTQKGFQTPIVNKIVCKKIKDLLGGQINYMVSGSAPLSPETHEFIRSSFNVTLIQGYGLTETAAGATLMNLEDMSVGRAGPPIHGTKIKLADWDEGNYHVTDLPYPRGEIVIGGDSVTAGYYKNDQLTTESFRDEEGLHWFYTGDIGEIHPDGSVKIIDRKKDLVKLQFGEYISLGKVETELKSCPLVDNICIYGDSFHTYVIALVTPNPKFLSTIAKSLGKDSLTREQLCRDLQVLAACSKAIIDHAKKAKLHKMETPTKIILCPEEWTPDSGLVTAAMKIRRRNIQDHYKRDINLLYGLSNGNSI